MTAHAASRRALAAPHIPIGHGGDAPATAWAVTRT